MPAKAFSTNVLILSLLCYAAMAALFSWIQSDYICADFVAYITIARRTISEPWMTVTSYWAPLYSWSMIPFLLIGLDDLVTGRLVLVISGFAYLMAIHRLTVIHATGRVTIDRLIQVGTMTCAVIQSTIWATYLLDPDLLANAFLYLYFGVTTASYSQGMRWQSAMKAGALAGMSYLAKAYMLPFCVLHFLLTMGLRYRTGHQQKNGQSRQQEILQSVVLFFAGLALIAGPWVASISWNCGHLCFSSAGAANHANMGPEAFRKDPLWHPGIQRDYIFEPRLNAPWSPIKDLDHFWHQLQIVNYNVMNCIGLIPVWLIFFLTSFSLAMTNRLPVVASCWWYVIWVGMTVLIYCGGYTTVNLEARYIIPTVVPLMCHASLMIAGSLAATFLAQPSGDAARSTQFNTSRLSRYISKSQFEWFASRPLLSLTGFILLLSAVDIDNLIRIATKHPQAVKLQSLRVVGEQFRDSGFAELPITCNDWHLGLYVSYSAEQLTNYWGSPLSQNLNSLVTELDDHEMKVFLRFVRETDPRSYFPYSNPFSDSQHWTRRLTIRDQRIKPDIVEVYVRR